jgi:hypothetical protein
VPTDTLGDGAASGQDLEISIYARGLIALRIDVGRTERCSCCLTPDGLPGPLEVGGDELPFLETVVIDFARTGDVGAIMVRLESNLRARSWALVSG